MFLLHRGTVFGAKKGQRKATSIGERRKKRFEGDKRAKRDNPRGKEGALFLTIEEKAEKK